LPETTKQVTKYVAANSRYEWAQDWPDPTHSSQVARKFAARFGPIASWLLLGELLPRVRTMSPARIARGYSSDDRETIAIVERFLLEAGYVLLSQPFQPDW
jgi:hypothetical protein